MTENHRKIYNYGSDHTRFGGLIYLSDFDTNYCNSIGNRKSLIASRITSDEIFDEKCRKNIEYRRRTSNKKSQNT